MHSQGVPLDHRLPHERATQEALKTVADATLAYEFKYPVKTASGKPLSVSTHASRLRHAVSVLTPFHHWNCFMLTSQLTLSHDALRAQMALSRKPEKYSSAAPLSADARQRIVAEVIDLVRAVTVSVTVRLWHTAPPCLPAVWAHAAACLTLPRSQVGPAIGKLKKLPLDEWEAQDVAELVLADRLRTCRCCL